MPDRPGDIAIEERVNSGQCELSHFMPANTISDMVTGINKSGMKRWIWKDERLRNQHASTRRDLSYAQPVILPDYVISNPIKIGDRIWNYKTDSELVSLRRIFIEKDQAIQLDIPTTLSYLSATEGTGRYEQTISQLQEEVADLNNQVIMQLMHNRVLDGQPMLPFCPKKLRESA